MKKNFLLSMPLVLIMLATVMMPLTLKAQLTVTVPDSCEVVVAGIGGTLGFGGRVGHHGVVTMKDPEGGGVFTINKQITDTIDNWVIKGDLSVNALGIGVSGSAIQTLGYNVTSADIITYNKTLRNKSENTKLSDPVLARSKGRITINYTAGMDKCHAVLEFDVYKRYSHIEGDTLGYIPKIVGPSCWETGRIYTYSVDQIASDNLDDAIGVDRYYWTITDANGIIAPDSTIYTSADKSSITIQAPDTLAEPYTMVVCYGRANHWNGDAPNASHSVCVSKSIGAVPSITSASYPTCLPVDAKMFIVSVDPYNNEYTYTWTSSVGAWGLYPNANGDTLKVITNGNQDPGNINLKILGCQLRDTTFRINRSFDLSTSILTEPNTNCYNAGDNITFSVSPSSVQSNFTNWIFPTGWTDIAYKNSAHSIVSVTLPSNIEGGSYIVKAYTCDSLYSISDTINIRPKAPVFVSGDTCITYGSTSPFSITVSPAGNYIWTQPWGNNITGTETQQFTPNGANGGTITVIGINGSCQSLNSLNLNIKLGSSKPNNFTYTCINYGVPTTFTVNNAPNPFYGTYNVTDSAGTFLSSFSVDNSTGAITITPLSTANANTQYTLWVSHSTNCGISQTTPLTFTYSKHNLNLTAFYDDGSVGSDEYRLGGAGSGITAATPVTWTIDGTPYNKASEPYNRIFLTNSNTSSPTEVCAETTINGCTTRLCMNPDTSQANYGRSSSQSPTNLNNTGKQNASRLIKVFPNPNGGTFNIEIDDFKNSASAKLLDAQGKVVSENILRKGITTISQKLVSGQYLLVVSIDEKTIVHKIQVN